MKHIILFIAFVLAVCNAKAQARLGSTVMEIKNEYSDYEYQLKSSYLNDGTYYIQITTDRATVWYYFNDDRVCYLTVVVPDNQGALNFYVELYNSKYVVVSSTEWKMYSNNGICKIKLVYPDGGGYYFAWTN